MCYDDGGYVKEQNNISSHYVSNYTSHKKLLIKIILRIFNICQK